jgi:mRNA interferase MazF
MYQRGDIVSIPFPFTDLSQSKLRPALIISNSLINRTEDVIAVMITSVLKEDGVNVFLTDSDVSVPLPRLSAVRCYKVVTLSQSLIQKTISSANPSFVDKVVVKINNLIRENESHRTGIVPS